MLSNQKDQEHKDLGQSANSSTKEYADMLWRINVEITGADSVTIFQESADMTKREIANLEQNADTSTSKEIKIGEQRNNSRKKRGNRDKRKQKEGL